MNSKTIILLLIVAMLGTITYSKDSQRQYWRRDRNSGHRQPRHGHYHTSSNSNYDVQSVDLGDEDLRFEN